MESTDTQIKDTATKNKRDFFPKSTMDSQSTDLINKLLWSKKKRWQIIGAAIGAFIGLLMLLGSLQIYFDIKDLLGGNEETNQQFVIINKRVNLLNTLGVRSTFSDKEIADIKNQSFIENIGQFTPNQFKVSASNNLLGFYTELFFESIPNDFIDVETQAFQWEKGQKELPIILSKDYLALYNFGFAPSQGLPQFTESTIGKVSVDINIKGRTGGETFKGRIVGFSDRINSILVPDAFMTWANQNYGNSTKKVSSRLILKTNNSSTSDLRKYIEQKGFELSTGRLIGGQLGTILKLITGIIVVIGFLILLLSIAVFALNFQLIISQANRDIQLLLQLGYKQKQISQFLIRNLGILFGIIFLGGLLVLLLSHYLFAAWANNQGIPIGYGLHWLVVILAVLFAIGFFMINSINIQKNIAKIY